MALYSANGGGVIVPGPITVPVGTWTGNWMSRDAEVTQSDSGGCTLYRNVVQDNSWSFTAARDSVLYPEAVGLTQGLVIAQLLFQHGSTGKADKLTNSLVTRVSPVNDNANDVGRVTVEGKGGFLTPSVNG